MSKTESFLQIILISTILIGCTSSVERLEVKVDSLKNQIILKERALKAYESILFENGLDISHNIENDSVVILEIVEDDEPISQEFTLKGRYLINSTGTIKNGQETLAHCNVCPELEFSDHALLTLLNADKSSEKHTWKLTKNMLTIQIVEPTENTIIRKSMYFVQSTDENSFQLTSKGNDFIVNMSLIE